MRLSSLWPRLRERKLVQWAIAYLAGAWVLLQVLDLVGNRFGWPDALLRALIVLAVAGFFATLVVAWYHGEKGNQRVSGPEVLMLGALLVMAGAAVSFVARADPKAGGSAPAAAGGAPQERITFPAEQGSVAVLPFVNLSGDPAQEYFSDGLTEELLNELAQIAELRVAARTSSFAFKGKNLPVEEIARQLRVGAVVEGSVRRDGERLRVTAQLINASTGYHLWSESYNRELTGIFQVQEELARSIAGALRVRLAGTAGEGRRTANLQAHDLYLLGLHHWHQREVRDALARFEQAVAADSTYGLAWAGIALTHVVFPVHTPTSPHEAMPKAKAAALRALALDSTLAQAHAALALVAENYEWDWPAADRFYRRALALRPGYATAHQWYSTFLLGQRRFDEALVLGKRAAALDPLLMSVHWNLARVYTARGEYESALTGYRRMTEAHPEISVLWLHRAYWSVLLSAMIGHLLVEEGEIRRWAELGSFDPTPWLALASAIADPTQRPAALQAADGLATRGGVWQQIAAQFYAQLGAHERALDVLERLYEQRSGALPYIGTDPAYDPLRTHPRFQRLVRQVGLQP